MNSVLWEILSAYLLPNSLDSTNTQPLQQLQTDTHTHACKHTASILILPYSAHSKIINRLLTREHSLKRLHPCLPIVHRVYCEKYISMKMLTPSLSYSSCYQNGRRSLKEGHFIQLSLSSYWRRQGGRKETEWEGGREVVAACVFCTFEQQRGKERERRKFPLCIFSPVFFF